MLVTNFFQRKRAGGVGKGGKERSSPRKRAKLHRGF
jgi:hypothetical protein